MGVAAEPRPATVPGRGLLGRSATTVALVSAATAGLALVAKLLLESRRTSFSCGNAETLVLDWLQIASLAFSALAVIGGITAIACRTRHPGWVVLAVLSAGIVAALILVPGALGGYLCQVIVA